MDYFYIGHGLNHLNHMQAIIHDLDFFDNFLDIVNKFVHQCQFIISKTELNVYCRNPDSFQTSRLLLKTDVMTLKPDKDNEKEREITSCLICIKDILALKTAFSMAKQIEEIDSAKIDLVFKKSKDDSSSADVSQIKYTGKNGYSFSIVATAPDIIKNYISRDTTTQLDEDWAFMIDPKKLALAQSRASSIVKFDDANILLTKDTNSEKGRVLVKFSGKNESVNAVSIPIAERSIGSLEATKQLSHPYDEVCIHESSFRIFNILSVKEADSLRCFYNIKYNTFFLTSEIKNNDFFISSRLFAQMVKKESWSGR